MTTLRTAAQQALEALEISHPDLRDKQLKAITALRAALAEPTGKDSLQVEPVQEPVQESTCNGMPAIEGPLSRSQRMREAGFTRRPRGWVKDGDEPVQEPVAWIEHEWSGTGLRTLRFERRDPTVRDEVVNPVWTPLYTHPPQRTPLTEDQIAAAANSVRWSDQYHVDFARAIERAHGIGGQE